MTSFASGLAGYGKTVDGLYPNPKNVNQFFKTYGGFSGAFFSWTSPATQRLGLVCEGLVYDKTAIKNAVCAGNKIVILNVRNGGHWVLATSANDTAFGVMEPGGYTSTSYTRTEVSQALVYRLA